MVKESPTGISYPLIHPPSLLNSWVWLLELNPGLSHERQRHTHLKYHLLVHSVHINRNLQSGVKTGLKFRPSEM